MAAVLGVSTKLGEETYVTSNKRSHFSQSVDISEVLLKL